MSDTVRADPDIQIDDFADLYDSAPCGYLSLLPDGRIAHANKRIAVWTGYAQSDLIGRSLRDVMSAAALIFYETSVSPLLRLQGFVDEVAIDFMAADRTKIQCLVNAAERRGSKGDVLFIRLTIFKATERRRYERSLVDANEAAERAAAAERETSQLREQFIAVLGHDLRNPLASISSGVRLLSDREAVSDRGTRILTLMQGSVNRASELIDNVMDFARGRLGGGITLRRDALSPLTPVLDQVVAEIVSVAPGRDIRAAFAIAEPVDCDRVRLGQLLSNLLGNAVAYGDPTKPIFVRGETCDDRLLISIANGGAPIDAAMMEKLFRPFFRGDIRPNQAGLGLGLHIASQIAKAHEGTLTVVSTVDETKFTFAMPLIPTRST